MFNTEGKIIFIRLDSITALLYEKFLELKSRKFQGALNKAFSYYGIIKNEEPSENLYKRIKSVSLDISRIVIMHELGEAAEDDHLDEWLELLNNSKNRETELFLRGIKDMLSDTTDAGPINFILESKEISLLCFYIVLLDSVRKELFPEIINAFQSFITNGDWSLIKRAKETGYMKAKKLRDDVLMIWNQQGSMEEIERYIKTIYDHS